MQDEAEIICPYCGESFSLAVDRGEGRRQQLTIDCEVCCRPISVDLTQDEDGHFAAEARAEDQTS